MGQIFIRSRRRSFRTVRAGEYLFANDGGATGAISTGVFVPALAIMVRFNVKTITAPTSGGAATIAFGFSGSTQALMVTTGFAAFVAGQVQNGVDLNANPFMQSTTFGNASEIIMTIGTAALTAGRFAFDIEYAEYDF